jgi:hypothetical protein
MIYNIARRGYKIPEDAQAREVSGDCKDRNANTVRFF